jgi:hypothetical protein
LMQNGDGVFTGRITSDSITSNSITVNGYISIANAAYISSGTTLTLKGTSVKLTNALNQSIISFWSNLTTLCPFTQDRF